MEDVCIIDDDHDVVVVQDMTVKLWPCLCFRACGWRGKPPADKGVDSLLSWHKLHFWVCITFCKVQHGDSVTKSDYYYIFFIWYIYYCDMEAEIQILLKKFPDSSISIPKPGWCQEGHPKTCCNNPWRNNCLIKLVKLTLVKCQGCCLPSGKP